MNDIKTFTSEQFGDIRTIEKNGEPWFVGKDVAEILGYTDTAQAIRKHIDSEDKGVVKTTTPGGIQSVTIVNESGLYSLIMSSKLPTAKAFKHWVTAEVLPAIRKHGMYAKEELLNNPDLLIEMATALKAEREENAKLGNIVKNQACELAVKTPKAEYYDDVLNSEDTIPISVIAKDYGMSAMELNKKLHDWGVQYQCNGVWLLYQKYANQGYTKTNTLKYKTTDGIYKSVTHTYWTQKGRKFIHELIQHNSESVYWTLKEIAAELSISIILLHTVLLEMGLIYKTRNGGSAFYALTKPFRCSGYVYKEGNSGGTIHRKPNGATYTGMLQVTQKGKELITKTFEEYKLH